MLNILITGSNGQLGSEIKVLSSEYPYHFFFTDKENLDVSNEKDIENFIESNAINRIINCAAYTAVDKAEKDAQNANIINHLAVKYLAQISKEKNIHMIHISTDYVFDGIHHTPYTENDSVCPINVYGQTKLDGEIAMQNANPKNSIILRTSWVYSSFGNNFVKTMLYLGKERNTLGVIFDQIGTPTYARDLAKTILEILPKLQNQNVEIFNYSNEGILSWYDFSKAIFELSKIECYVNPIETKEYPTPAKRPHYSLLNKSKVKKTFNITIPYWKDSLVECLEKMGENK